MMSFFKLNDPNSSDDGKLKTLKSTYFNKSGKLSVSANQTLQQQNRAFDDGGTKHPVA
jgi:hypothetical protein